MKTRFLTVATLLALISFLVPVCGFADDDEDSPVGKEMGTINRSFKKLSRQYADATKKDSSLELVAAMQKAVENSKGLTPSKAGKAQDKAKYMATFKQNLEALDKELVLLKDAISADKTDVAKAELDKIDKMKGSSHKELGVGGGRRGGPGGPGGWNRGNQGPGAGGAAKPAGEAPVPAASPAPVQ
jgi:hypothetical protein